MARLRGTNKYLESTVATGTALRPITLATRTFVRSAVNSTRRSAPTSADMMETAMMETVRCRVAYSFLVMVSKATYMPVFAKGLLKEGGGG